MQPSRRDTGTDRAEPSPAGAGGGPTRRVVIGGLLFLLVLLGLAGYKSYRDLESVRERKAELELELERTEGDIDALEARIDRLQNDPLTLERLAREQLQMVRPGEVVIVLPEEAPAGGVAVAEPVRSTDRPGA